MSNTIEVTAPQFLSKKTTEKRKLRVDFTNWLETDETISNPDVTHELVSGEASDLEITSVTVSSPYVIFFVDAGSHASSYRLKVKVDTSEGQTLDVNCMLRVIDK